MLDLVTLGAEVARRRSGLGLTQKVLAERARVSRATLDALENGRTGELGFTKIARILATLGMNLTLVKSSRGRPTLEDLMDEDDDQGMDRSL